MWLIGAYHLIYRFIVLYCISGLHCCHEGVYLLDLSPHSTVNWSLDDSRKLLPDFYVDDREKLQVLHKAVVVYLKDAPPVSKMTMSLLHTSARFILMDETHLARRVNAVSAVLNISPASVKKMLSHSHRAHALLVSDPHVIEGRIKALGAYLNLTYDDVSRMVFKHPPIILGDTGLITAKFDELAELFGSIEAVASVLKRYPGVMSKKVENFITHRDIIMKTLAISDDDFKKMAFGAPAILGLSIDDSILPKISYYKDVCAARGVV